MKETYERFKGLEIAHPTYRGTLCGYTDSNLILATVDKPNCSFRKTDKHMTIYEEFKDVKYRYCFENEAEFIKQHPTV